MFDSPTRLGFWFVFKVSVFSLTKNRKLTNNLIFVGKILNLNRMQEQLFLLSEYLDHLNVENSRDPS